MTKPIERCVDCPDKRTTEDIKEVQASIDGLVSLFKVFSDKVNIMWGWRFPVAVAFTLIISGLFIMILVGDENTRENKKETVVIMESARSLAEAARESSVLRDQLLSERFLALHEQAINVSHDITRVMDVISLNQKIVMESLGLKYMKPDYGDRSDEE